MLPHREFPDPPQIHKPIKIVCMSDLHNCWGMGTLNDHERDISGNLLLIAGDIVSGAGNKEQYESFARWLQDLKFERIIAIPGNHDVQLEVNWDIMTRLFKNDPRVTFLNQETVEYRGLKIYGEPRQPAFYDWAFNIPRGRMARVWDKVPPDTDILLTHGPPLGAGDVARGKQLGCKYQREWIIEHQPKLVVCGHIHPGYGYYQLGKTTVINAACLDAGYNPTNVPPVIHLSTT